MLKKVLTLYSGMIELSRAVIPCSSLIALANGAELIRQQIGIDLTVKLSEIGTTEGQFRANLLESSRIFLKTFEGFTEKISEPMLDGEDIELAQIELHKLILQLTVINESLRCKLGDI